MSMVGLLTYQSGRETDLIYKWCQVPISFVTFYRKEKVKFL